MKNYESLSHTRYDCKYHVVFIPKYRRKKIYGAIRRHLGEIFSRAGEAEGKSHLGRRPVQKHKRTQDWRAGPFRSSSTYGEPQFWGVSEAMSAIRVPRTRRENTVQHEVPRSRAETWIQARAAQGSERASRLRRGKPWP